MIEKKFMQKLKKEFLAYADIRREIIKESGDALHLAKRVIFDLHKGDTKEAKQKLADSHKILLQLRSKYGKNLRAMAEGSLNAALEEYTEAELFMNFVQNKSIGKISMNLPSEVYLAGLLDVPGELLRYTVKFATKRDYKMAEKCLETGQEIVGELIEFDLTSYLRNKFDQAKNAVRKMEEVLYELSIRKNNP